METESRQLGLTAGGRPVALRTVTPDDEEFLLGIYASTRERELAQVPWGEGEKERFVRWQFDLQRREYAARFPDAEYDVVLVGGRAAGRVWVGADPGQIRLLDIAVLPEFQNLGVGTLLLRALIERARREGKPLRHMVFTLNDEAHRFYERLGFVVIEDFDAYKHMEWRAEGAG
jgi:ribosomal protein S18 acetylase RimI-like enzyme